MPGWLKLFCARDRENTDKPPGYEWLFNNNLASFFANMHQYGWLNSMSPQGIETMDRFLQKSGFFLKALTLLTEISGLLLLWKRKPAMLILAGCVCTHIGIFIFGGIMFWKWIAVDILLLIVVYKMDKGNAETVFNKQNFRLSLIVIAFSFIWFRPITFDWFDTKMSQFFTYEIADDKGNAYHLERNSMNPYHQFFQYEPFLYLVNGNTLDIRPFGNTNKFREAKIINQAAELTLPLFIEKYGKNRYDTNKVRAYEDFIRIYFANRNKRVGTTFFPALIAAPNHLYNSEAVPVYSGHERVKKFGAIFNETYRNDSAIVTLEKDTAIEVNIP